MKADLHIHTTFSDGVSSPKEIVKTAIKKGIDCICITDHHSLKGAIEAMKFGFDKDILVIPGIEVLTSSGEVLGINVKKRIPPHLSIEEAIREIRRQGGIAVIPHPFNRPFLGFWGGERKLGSIDVDAIEVFNASTIFSSSNKKALSFVRKKNLCSTAGSDAHRKEFVGRGYVEITEKLLSEKDLVEAVMQKNLTIRGRHLNFYEIVRNGSNADIRETVSSLLLRRKMRKINTVKKKIKKF